MTKPVYKIETYTGVTLDHTITDDCLSVQVMMALTDQLSNFSFAVPATKEFTKSYDDVAVFDKVKIYLGYDSVPANPLLVGRVENIQNQWEEGKYIRVISGHDLGEVTNRRIRHQYSTGGATATVAVTKWATDCGLGTDITADGTPVSIVSYQTKYDNLLRDICDYAATINKDWYVDINNNLVWKTRPLRTVGVSSFTVGGNIKSYNLVRDINEVYNRFYVFGASEPPVDGTSACSDSQYTKSPTDIPSDHDVGWTESLTNWSVDSADDKATLNLATAYPIPHVGTYAITGVAAYGDGHQANEWITITRTFPFVMVKDSGRLEWVDYWYCGGSGIIMNMEIDLLAPDTSNYFRYTVNPTHYPVSNTNTHMYAELGPAREAITGYEKWVRVGDPSWYNLQGITSYKIWNNVVTEYCNNGIDGLYFSGLRWYAFGEDAGSQTNYGLRECVITDDRVHSNAEATNYVATWKAQKKDATLQLDVITLLDTNILVGDRIPITIPNENLTGILDFDVIRVRHSIGMEGALSRSTLISRERQRSPLKTTDTATILRDLQKQSTNMLDSRNIVK
jgi:hypothetical protein